MFAKPWPLRARALGIRQKQLTEQEAFATLSPVPTANNMTAGAHLCPPTGGDFGTTTGSH